ncbi:hypothetical protein B0J14DRAFT_561677 [Halenospora varia]|nr:hypothetical protein B0J14DRAFT_561677 [Halenospora varia]
MSSSKQLVGGGRKNGSGISKKGQPKKDVKKLLDTEEKEEEDDEDDMLTEDRDNAKKIKDGKADKKMKMFMSSINASSNEADGSSSSAAPENGTTTVGSNASGSGTSGPGGEISLTASGHSATSATSNDKPEAPTTSSLYERSTKAKAGIPFDEKTTPQTGPDHRFGDEKIGRKFVRQWNDFKGVLGVAYNCPLKDLMPRKVSGKKTYPRLEIWVKWTIDGKIHRVWRSPRRSSISGPTQLNARSTSITLLVTMIRNIEHGRVASVKGEKPHQARVQKWID